MANQEHLTILKQGTKTWNQWRKDTPDTEPDLRGATLSEAKLYRIDLSSVHLEGTDLSSADLGDADLRGAVLQDTNFSMADLKSANFEWTDLIRVNLSGADLRGAYLFRTTFQDVNFGGANLSRIDLSSFDLSTATLQKAILIGAKLSSVDFSGKNLSGADLRRADLQGTRFGGANLSKANLSGIDLSGKDFREAMLSKTIFTRAILTNADFSGNDLKGTDFSSARLTSAHFNNATLTDVLFIGADLTSAQFSNATMTGVNLSKAVLRETIFTKASLCEANLHSAILIGTDFMNAALIHCSVYGISVWDVRLDAAEQRDLIITPPSQPAITADTLEVAQFIYLLLTNPKIREVINTIGKKAVLILGRFTPERKAILEAVREKLRSLNFLPIVFDFDHPTSRDFTETIMILAGLSCFIIADITNPRSSPLELQALVPNYMIPFVPIIQEGEEPFPMFTDLQNKYPNWVLKPLLYDTPEKLLSVLEQAVVQPALERHDQLAHIKAQGLQTRHINEYL
jgi:uncharacterized protein YjbI with pentapeptide repeats